MEFIRILGARGTSFRRLPLECAQRQVAPRAHQLVTSLTARCQRSGRPRLVCYHCKRENNGGKMEFLSTMNSCQADSKRKVHDYKWNKPTKRRGGKIATEKKQKKMDVMNVLRDFIGPLRNLLLSSAFIGFIHLFFAALSHQKLQQQSSGGFHRALLGDFRRFLPLSDDISFCLPIFLIIDY